MRPGFPSLGQVSGFKKGLTAGHNNGCSQESVILAYILHKCYIQGSSVHAVKKCMCMTVCDGIIGNLLPTDKQHCHTMHAIQCSTEIKRLVGFGMHMNTISDSQANTQHKLELVMNTI